MVLLSVLPVGILQAWASVQEGLWYARSAEFLQMPLMDTLRWLRVIGDTIFTAEAVAAGAVAFGLFVVGLKTGWSVKPETEGLTEEGEAAEDEADLLNPAGT
jgi:nitric oxide reductase subunit B